MDRLSHVAVHESAFPENVRTRVVARLKRREVDPSLLYSGLRQTTRWVALHHALSPAQRERGCAEIYEKANASLGDAAKSDVIHVVSLACGDGTKDTRALALLRQRGRAVLYTPADFSLEMVLHASATAMRQLPGQQCTPLVCELAECPVLPAILKTFDPSGAERILFFLGTIHNYWPPDILRPILYPLRSQDHLLLGANLAPALEYQAALESILPQYDNPPTRDWLMGALAELDLGAPDGELTFGIVPNPAKPDLQRIEANFILSRDRDIFAGGESVRISAGEKLRVFYSYRFTIEHMRGFLEDAGLLIAEQWIDPSAQEGLFLCRRAATP